MMDFFEIMTYEEGEKLEVSMDIYKNLTYEEGERLKDCSDIYKIDYSNSEIASKVYCTMISYYFHNYDDVIPSKIKENRGLLSELACNDADIARLLIKAVERNCGMDKDYLLLEYLFDISLKEEDQLQRAMLPKLVKHIREQVGMSQKAFADKYDISKKSIEAWESGAKKISKYAFYYLKHSATQEIDWLEQTRILKLPLCILSKDTITYLDKCLNIDHTNDYEHGYDYVDVRHIEKNANMQETYIVEVTESSEKIVDGKVEAIWKSREYPEELQKCMQAAVEYECKQIWFDKNLDAAMRIEENSFDGKLNHILLCKYNRDYITVESMRLYKRV